MNIQDIRNVVCKVAPSYPVNSIDLFGSFARGNENENSDIDLLVAFNKPSATLFDLVGLRLDIQDILNVKVDVVSAPLKPDSFLMIDVMVRLYEA